MLKYLKYLIFYILILANHSYANEVDKIEIEGNVRISDETIKLFGDIDINKSYDNLELNKIIKNLYKTNFFEDIQISINGKTLYINVIENPIIQTIIFSGVKNKSIIDLLGKQLKMKEKSSFIKSQIKIDESILKNTLRANGYLFSEVTTKIKKNDNNTVDLNYEIELGEKAYIYNIKFIGNKKVKDRKLKNVIISEESKFWKFISNRKFLDRKRIKIDENLLRNFYKNNGYYDVNINSTFAQIVKKNQFELIFNIDAGEKYFFNNIILDIPETFNDDNFKDIRKTLNKLRNENYSLNRINEILNEIDKIVLQKQFQFINATYKENIKGNKIDLIINLTESEKTYVERINIYGNYITNENVLRNSIITNEGDAFNEILFKKSINKLKSKNIFEKVETNISEGSSPQNKIININVVEKPTGEIAAGAGTGTNGTAISFSISENNYLGQGTKLRANATLSDDSVEGLFSITNPNFKNTDKSLITTIESTKNDLMSKYGYETSKIGFSFGTSFEQYQDIFFSPSISTYLESLDTSSKASSAKRKQEGEYFDTNFSYSLTSNKLNQSFQPTDGYRTKFFQTLPILADDKSILNAFEYSKYTELENESVISFLFFARAINNFDDDVRVSKRIFIPSRKLRGFVSGRIGPKDSGDYIGGNYGSAFNVAATLPNLLVDLQNIDFSIFFDSANVWGVDYDSSLSSSKIRSSTGLAVDWFTPIGPLSFSFAQPISKASSDQTETFRFQLGTTF